MRKSIDHFDIAFLRLLAERMRVVRNIIHVKKKLQIDLEQSEARKEDMKDLIEMSVQLKLEKKFFRKILNLVFQDAIEKSNQEKQTDQMDEICSGLLLDDLRNNLLNLDKSLCLILAERFRTVRRIGEYKAKINAPPLDPKRWQQVLENKSNVAETLGISVSLVVDIFNSIHEVSLDIEHVVAGNS